MKKSKPDPAADFLACWNRLHLPPPCTEYVFHPPRKWRFDFAWPEDKLAVEIEGGTFVGGRHSQGAGYGKDCEKYNTAVLDGWRVLRYTAADLRTPVQVMVQVASAMQLVPF